MSEVSQISLIQALLNAEATIGNIKPQDEPTRRVRSQVIFHIEKLRGDTPPCCYGEDDCSTLILSMCPWRMTCGE